MSVAFDDPNWVSCAGLVPAMLLAERCGLHDLVAGKVTVPGPGGANASVKVSSLVAGMVSGADCIDDTDLLRHGGVDRLFGGVRAPSTLGTFLRSFTFGHVRQLDSVAAAFLVATSYVAKTPLSRLLRWGYPDSHGLLLTQFRVFKSITLPSRVQSGPG